MGIAGIVDFVLTEDITRLMVLLDRWTIVNAAIFILGLLGYALAFKREKNEDDETEDYGTESTR